MKKRLLSTAIAVVACSMAARADDDSLTLYGITLYGVIDSGVAYQTHGVPLNSYSAPGLEYLVSKSSNGARFSLAPNGLSQSKIGLKGVEDLGDGWSALFKADTGFDPLTGQLADGIKSVAQQNGVPLSQQTTANDSYRAGQAINGEAWAGISNAKYGTVTFGRQISLQADALGRTDPTQGSYAFSFAYSGNAGGTGNVEDSRLDNTIKYAGAFGIARLALMYQFPGTVGPKDSAFSANVGVDYVGLSVDAVYSNKKDQIGVAALSAAQVRVEPTGSVAATVSDNVSYSLVGRYVIDQLKLYAGYQYIIYANPSSPLSPGATDIGGYNLSVVNNTAYTNHRLFSYYFTGARYSITPKLDLATMYNIIRQNSFKGNGCSDISFSSCSGQLPTYTLIADYHFTQRFDTYAGVMYSHAFGGFASGFLHNNTADPMIGARFTF